MFFKKTNTQKIIKKNTPEDAAIKIGQMLSMELIRNPDSLNHEELTAALINTLEQEIHSGGFQSFYWNSYGDHTKRTIQAFEEIGSTLVMRLLKNSMKAFPDSQVPVDCNTRQELIAKDEEAMKDLWYSIDQEFWTCEENLPELLYVYIKENIDQFR